MEENVALDSSKQKKFVKSIKGIKKLIQKNKDKPEAEKSPTADGKIRKRKRKEKGLVYLAHIPHGFYENEMTQYFKQFGMVTNVRVIRSKRTGKSKGYAFVEFKEPSVAQIVAETMNNYLMGKRLLKAAYIPPKKQRPAMRKKWNSVHNPGSEGRLRQKKAHNARKTDEQEIDRARNILANLSEKKQKLRQLGIDYDFFMPVDIPEELSSEISTKLDKNEKNSEMVEKDSKGKKLKHETVKVKTENKESLTKTGKQTNAVKKEEKSDTNDSKNMKNKKDVKELNINTKQQKQKDQNLKERGVKPADNYIKIQEESDNDSDSSFEFDSDEYEKMIDNDDESLSEGEESDDGSDDGTGDDVSNEDDGESGLESEEDVPIKVKKGPLVLNPNKLKKEVNKKEKVLQQVKRKSPQAPPVPPVGPKKSKFEKQQKSQPLVKKQFKKKK